MAKRLFIGGRVQGVGFRYFTHDAAVHEGVTGYVRNLPDGRVEALLEGDEEAVARVERRIRLGPGGARVEQVDVSNEVPSGAYTSFRVTR